MSKRMKRRDFMRNGAVAGLALATTNEVQGFPTIMTQSAVKPLVIASANGNRFKNGGNVTAVQKAFTMITGGADVLDAVIAGVNIVELDPLDDSVGYGGLPNADGVVQLDSSCMHGPKKRAGAVAALEGVRTPSLVARAVLDTTDHHLIVGKGAQLFARNMGFKIEDDLNTDHSREIWLEWKRRTDPAHYLDPKTRAEVWRREGLRMVAEGLIDREHYYGTINCNGVNSKGEICGVTTTSGLAWKIPGRVGDSPILGAGLYVDGAVGARSEIVDGRYTGRPAGPFTYREGKAVAIRELSDRYGYDLAQSFAYSDSATDLPMLLAVGNPRVVNPGRALRRVATENHWPILRFTLPVPLKRRIPTSPRALWMAGGIAGALALIIGVSSRLARRSHASLRY